MERWKDGKIENGKMEKLKMERLFNSNQAIAIA